MTMKAFKSLGWQLFKWLAKILWGKGLGRFPLLETIYRYMYNALAPRKDTPVCVHDNKMFVSQGEIGFSEELLFSFGYDKCQTMLFQYLVTEGMTVIDIGAHIGYYTLLAAKLVGDKGEVFAFEPEPRNYALLLKNIEINSYKNVTPIKKAVFNKTGKVKLCLADFSGGHSLCRDVVHGVGTIMVDAICLDEFFRDKDYRSIDIIKMDIEGAEMAALKGMAKILETNDHLKIFTEFCPLGLQGAGVSPDEYWGKLIESGFGFIYLINEQKHELELTDFKTVMKFCRGTFFKKATVVNLLCTRTPLKVPNTS